MIGGGRHRIIQNQNKNIPRLRRRRRRERLRRLLLFLLLLLRRRLFLLRLFLLRLFLLRLFSTSVAIISISVSSVEVSSSSSWLTCLDLNILEVFNWLSYGTKRWFLYIQNSMGMRSVSRGTSNIKHIRYAHIICTNLHQREHRVLRQVLPMLRKLIVVISYCISWLLSNVD